jgi:hypothetical protein
METKGVCDMMGEAHPPTVSARNRAATQAAGTGPKGRNGRAPKLLRAALRSAGFSRQGGTTACTGGRRHGFPACDVGHGRDPLRTAAA